ncbi:hypothetical protein MTYP_02599 [Methylophilaceae bacterium]|nr:hypothetical protein MTYP_02599 [Methylophilaceae bacterium]
MKKITPLLLVLIAGSFPLMVHAASCDKLREDIDTASGLLNKSQQAKSFDEARRVMNSARHAINEIAEDARDCPCFDAANLFDDAATRVRRASDADAVGRFNDFGRQGVEMYGAAIEALNACPESRKSPQGQQSQDNSSGHGQDSQQQ